MIKVLVVDDSALIRSLLSEIIKSDPQLCLVGTAPDPYVARDMVNQFAPDVITLDVEMPKMDGLTFLKKLMKARPTPVLMISTLTEAGAETTLAALELGAVDFIPKPKLDVAAKIEEYRELILRKIKMAAASRIQQHSPARPSPAVPTSTKTVKAVKSEHQLIAIGASTGGTVALKQLLTQLPDNLPGIVVVQHMPAGFTEMFAKRLDLVCPQHIHEARQNDVVLPGHVYIAPGDRHLEVVKKHGQFYVHLTDGARVSGHKPSVDKLFLSVAQQAGAQATALIMTGMGNDGAHGIREIANAGGYCIAQDEASSVVFGMPQAAIKLGGVHQICSLTMMPEALLSQVQHES